jgi:hypothetical protein
VSRKARSTLVDGRLLNKFNKSPDGKCEWCMQPSPFVECTPCLESGPAVDARVRLEASRVAKCGHVSHDYYACSECKSDGEDQDTNGLYHFAAQVRSFDLRKLGAATPSGLVSKKSRYNTKGGRVEPSYVKDFKEVRLQEAAGKPRHRKSALGVAQSGDKWIAQINREGINRHLGTFDTEEEAHEAFLAEREQYNGYDFGDDDGSSFF